MAPQPFSRALTIAGKDLRQRVRDRSAYIFAVLAPFGLALILSGVFGPAFEGQVGFSYAVVDDDGGPLARVLIDEVLGPAEQEDGIEVRETDRATAIGLTEDGAVGAALIVPAGFSDAVLAGEPAEIEVVTDRGSRLAGDVAVAIGSAFASELTAAQVAVATALTAGAEDPAEELAARAAAAADPLSIEQVQTSDRVLDPPTYFSAGLAIFFLFFTVQFGVIGLLEERQQGTLARLLASPVPRGAVVAGKGISSCALGLASMAVLVVATSLMLGAEWGDPAGVAALVVAAVVAALAIMAVVATVARTVEQANTYGGIIAIVLGMLGGSFFPVAQGPGLVADASRLTPHAWFMRGLENLADGSGAAAVGGPVLAILAFAAVGFVVAGVRIRRVVAL